MLIIFLITFIGLMGFGIVLPLFPFYAERLGASPEIITLTMSVFSLGQFFAAPFWGRISDSIGRKKVLIISLFGSGLSYVMLAYAETLTLVILSRVFAGLMAGNISIAFAYVSDITIEADTFRPKNAILALVSCGLIFYCAMSLMEAIFPLWANKIFDYGPSHIGAVFFMLGSIAVIIQGGLIGRLTKIFGEKRLVQIAATSVMIGLTLIGSAVNPIMLWGGLFFYGSGAAMFNPSLSSMVSKSAKENERGQFLGQYQAACAMGRIIGPTFSGVLYSNFSPSTPLYAGVIIAIPVIFLIANFTLRKPEGVIE